MDLNQFTLNAQNALQAAQSLASEYGHAQVDNEHLFLALLRQEEGVVAPLLKKIGVDPGALDHGQSSARALRWARSGLRSM